jgi:hypothetical protein
MDETNDVASFYDSEPRPERPIPRPEGRSNDQTIPCEYGGQQLLSQVGLRSSSEGTQSSTCLASQRTSSAGKPSTELILFSQPLQPQVPGQSLPSFDHPLTIEELIDQGAAGSSHPSSSEEYVHNQLHSLPPIYSNTPVWPLTDPSEALLLRHFVQNLAIWVRRTLASFGVG